MNFNEKQAIYLQIASIVCDTILEGKWKVDDKIPSVRELAVDLQVNPNTVMRAYDHLQQEQILMNKRGIGHHVAARAAEIITKTRKNHYLTRELPQLFRNLMLLGYSPEELKTLFENYLNQTSQADENK